MAELNVDLGPVGEVDGAAWRSVLELAEDERPLAVVVEGTWWREEHTRRRLERLEGVRELGIPDLFVGRMADRALLYACPYGAPRTAEVVHVACMVGVRLAVQLGSCGITAPGIAPGDVIVPTDALGLDGVTPLYAGAGAVASSDSWSERAAAALERRGITAHRGGSVTWPTLFNQPLARVHEWGREGRLGVDMETATTFAVAGHLGAAAISMLVAWDEILSGRSFLDPLSDAETAAFATAEDATYDVTLELLEAL